MGIEIYTVAKIPAAAKGGRPIPRDQLFRSIAEAAEEYTTEPLLQRLLQSESHEHTMFLTLHPAGPALEITWEPGRTVMASIKTSTVGPGFHAHVVGLLKHIGSACNLDWDWTDADESNFAQTGDFEALQESMIEHLGFMGEILAKHGPRGGDDTPMAIHMSWGAPLVIDAEYSVSPSGAWPREWWATFSESPRQHAIEFYPWWNREPDALFREQLGRALLWSQIRWHPPEDEREEQLYQLAIDCLDSPPPMPEVDELRQLLAYDEEEDELPLPRPGGFGMYRRNLRFRITSDWSIVLPGYFYCHVKEDGSGIAYGYGMREVHLGTYTFEGDNGVLSPEQILAEAPESPEHAETLELVMDGLLGRGSIVQEEDEDGEELWVLQGMIAGPGAATVCTITFGEAADRDWAIETFRSLRYSGPAGFDPQAARAANLQLLSDAGFKVAPQLPLRDPLPQLRPLAEIARRLAALNALFVYVTAPESRFPTDSLLAYIRANELERDLTEDEAKILRLDRAAAQAKHDHAIGWRTENVLPLAWILGLADPPDFQGQMLQGPDILQLVTRPEPREGTSVAGWLAELKARPTAEVAAMEDLFYCAHNAARSAQVQTKESREGRAVPDTVPPGFDPVANGGVIHERRHALTWALSPGVDWDQTSLDT